MQSFVSSLVSGDVGCFSGTFTSGITINTSGVTLQNTPGAKAILDFSGLGQSATAVGIKVGASGVTIAGDGGLEIDNLVNTSSGTSSAGIECSGSSNTTVKGVVFRNDNNPIHCAYASGDRIINNQFLGVRGDAAVGLAGSTGGFDNNVVSGNTFQMLTQPGNYYGPDGVQNGSGVTIANNTFTEQTTSLTTSDQHPDMVQNQGDYTKVYGNTFTDVGDSDFDFDTFADTTPNDIYIYDNVFRVVHNIDPYPDFIRLYSSGSKPTSITNFKVMNNLFADANGGGGIPPVNFCFYQGGCNSPSTSGNQITNNIFVNDGDGSTSGAMLSLSASAGSGWTADHNVYYRSSNGYVTWKGVSYTASSFVSSVDTSGSTALPAFASYALQSSTDNFDLSSTDTVARNTGTSLSSLFTTDMDGVSRPQGAAWDRGPYEVVGG